MLSFANGTTRRTIIIWRFAIKLARGPVGRRCNEFEARTWQRSSEVRRAILCPVLLALPFGIANVMPRAVPLSDDEMSELIERDALPDWDYAPGGEEEPFEYKPEDWGRLDGRIVALDYAAPAIFPEDEAGS